MENINFESLLGKKLSPEIIDALKSSGRIKFPFKNVDSPSAFSSNPEEDVEITDESLLDDILKSVAENEKLVKTLEDMRDDQLRGMGILPSSDRGKKAAMALNGSDDPIIHKDTFEKAQTILDPDYMVTKTTGTNPKLVTLIGEGTFDTIPTDCDEINKDIFDTQFIKKSPSGTLEDIDVKSTNDDIEEKFSAMLQKMMKELINKLFWNYIYCRIIAKLLDIAENPFARIIDTVFITVRYIFNKRKRKNILKADGDQRVLNFYRYGRIHRVLNRVKIILLCVVPKKAWKKYEPEEGIKIYIYDSSGGKVMELKSVCTENFTCSEPVKPNDTPDDEDADEDGLKFKERLRRSSGFPIDEEDDLDGGDSNKVCFDNNEDTYKGIESDGDSPIDCVESAKIVLDAAYNDALRN